MTDFFGNIAETITNMADKAALANAQSAGGAMRIQPDKVDEVARFFEDEAQAMEDRQMELSRLAMPGLSASDPVSTQARTTYQTVASGNDTAYMDNYLKLAKVFKDTAANMRASAQQTRTDDMNAEDAFRA